MVGVFTHLFPFLFFAKLGKLKGVDEDAQQCTIVLQGVDRRRHRWQMETVDPPDVAGGFYTLILFLLLLMLVVFPPRSSIEDDVVSAKSVPGTTILGVIHDFLLFSLRYL